MSWGPRQCFFFSQGNEGMCGWYSKWYCLKSSSQHINLWTYETLNKRNYEEISRRGIEDQRGIEGKGGFFVGY